MTVLIAALVAACALAAALLGLGRLPDVHRERARAGVSDPGRGAGSPRTCPLCSSPLSRGERIRSSLFPGKADRIMHIFGCPRCWPADVSSQMSRICPVCGRSLDAEGYLIARYFERPNSPSRGGGAPSRPHVHVLGCTSCRS